MIVIKDQAKIDFAPTICVTHKCNLSCIYCYQQHDKSRMDRTTAKRVIDWIFENIPEGRKSVTISLIGGEPLLEFKLIQQIYEYTMMKKGNIPVRFFASTNGTIMTSKMKEWFNAHSKEFILGLSLDGNRETQNYNRSNSYDLIDYEFFIKNWPNQGVKMTLSEFSLDHLAENVKFVYSLGFKKIDGTNLAEGDFEWEQERFIKMLIPQLEKLVSFYLENPNLKLIQMFDRRLELCDVDNREIKKNCGIGSNIVFFDTDGKRFPCSFVTPMTFSVEELNQILETDFNESENFIDYDCYNNCYIYPICSTCAGGNYQANKSFSKRNRSKCKINKLIALFIADLHSKRIIKFPELYPNETILYHTIEAIKHIRELYLDEYIDYLI